MRPAHQQLKAAALALASVVMALGGTTTAVVATPGVAAAAGTNPSYTPPGAPGSSPASSGLAATRAEADTIAAQIQAQGQRLDQLAEEADAAQLHAQQVDAQLAATRSQMAATGSRLAATEADLRRQAIAAYINGGAPQRAGTATDLTDQVVIADTYAAVIAAGEHQTATRLGRLRAKEAAEASALAAQQRSAHAALLALRASQQQAATAQARQEATLSQVRGQLAAMVAAAEASQARTQAKSEQAVLASTGQLPAATPAVSPPSGGSQAPAGSASAGAPPAPDPANPSPPQAQPQPPEPAPVARPVATTAPPTTRAPVTTAPPPPTYTPPPAAPAGGNVPAPGWQTAVRVAEAQIGKPYQWGGAGPNSYDCSGLVMVAWGAAGVSFPHLAQDQYDMTQRIPLSDLLPGDLVFFGTPSNVYHVGIYVGGGDMVDAPDTGQDVQIQSIYWSSLLGGGRVRG